MRLWRVSRYRGLSGVGGTYSDSRWHQAPRRVLFAAEHPALAVLEVLAHLRIDLSQMPTTLRLFAIDLKPRASISLAPELPSGWHSNTPTTQTLGNAWLDKSKSLCLRVPSALLPHAHNYVINPRHKQATTHLNELDLGPFWLDPCLVR